MRTLKDFNDECPKCGTSPVSVFTAAKQDYVYDGDDVECLECGLTGCINISDEDDDGIADARVDWNDFDE